jgi:chromosome segregation ATPase
MLTVNKLEKIIELENTLKAKYVVKLDALASEISGHIADKNSFIRKNEEKQAVIATQLKQITGLTTQATENKHLEQLNRELGSRAEKLQEEVAELKSRMKSLQKDIAKEREELKTLKQFDPAKMKKNLDAAKKKQVENQTANTLLQKSLNKTRNEKTELEQRVKELEARLAELEALEVNEYAEVKSETAA